MPQNIEDNTVAVLTFTLKDADGTVLQEFPPERPTAYLHGRGNLNEGLEARLTGLSAGETFEFTLSPEEGYGEPSGNEPQRVPRKEFRKDARLEAGVSFVAEGSSGNALRLWITRADRRWVWETADHPFAGKTVTIAGKVISIRTASAVEISHGHAHGVGGHHH